MKKYLNLGIIVLVIFSAAIFLYTFSNMLGIGPLAAAEKDIGASDLAVEPTSQSTSSIPKVLSIPSLGLHSQIESVGETLEGNMAVPSNLSDVGWYRYGPEPGQNGNAVIAGHLGIGIRAVFNDLASIRPGADVFVENKGGTTHHFKVDRIAIYPSSNVPLEEIFNGSDNAHLNLITCAGDWLFTKNTTDKRLVVFTTLSKD